MYVVYLSDKTLEYINYIFDSIMIADKKYIKFIEDGIKEFFKDYDNIEKNYVIQEHISLNNYDDILAFKIYVHFKDYDNLNNNDNKINNNDQELDYFNNTFIINISDDYDECINNTNLYIGINDSKREMSQQWDKFEKYIKENTLKKLYNEYKKDFDIYIYPAIKDEVDNNLKSKVIK